SRGYVEPPLLQFGNGFVMGFYPGFITKQGIDVTVKLALSHNSGILHLNRAGCSIAGVGVFFFTNVFALAVQLFEYFLGQEYFTPYFETCRVSGSLYAQGYASY